MSPERIIGDDKEQERADQPFHLLLVTRQDGSLVKQLPSPQQCRSGQPCRPSDRVCDGFAAPESYHVPAASIYGPTAINTSDKWPIKECPFPSQAPSCVAFGSNDACDKVCAVTQWGADPLPRLRPVSKLQPCANQFCRPPCNHQPPLARREVI